MTARSIDRSYVARSYGQYIAHLLSNNDYTKTPQIIIPYTDVIQECPSAEKFYNNAKQTMSKDRWEKEYLCKIKGDN